jgi:glutaconate CoA-transferase subunit B
MWEIFSFYLQRGLVSVGFMGGAQIDQFGNVNATVIGPYAKPKTRLPGSGGSMEIAAWADRCYFISPHEKRRFPPRVDFRTSAGFLGGRAERQAAGLRGGGPAAVVTNLGILEPDEAGELVLAAVHPGVDPEQARAQTGWNLRVLPDLRATDPVTRDELSLLRQLDPQRIYLS